MLEVHNLIWVVEDAEDIWVFTGYPKDEGLSSALSSIVDTWGGANPNSLRLVHFLLIG